MPAGIASDQFTSILAVETYEETEREGLAVSIRTEEQNPRTRVIAGRGEVALSVANSFRRERVRALRITSRFAIALAFGALLAAAYSPVALAQTEARDLECSRPVAAEGAPTFDDPLHARWYARFWTGECAGLFPCLAGTPRWNSYVAQLTAEATPANAEAVHAKACYVGRLVGFEWARDNAVRRLDTNDVRKLIRVITAPGDPLVRLNEVERRAKSLLARGSRTEHMSFK